MLGYDKRELWGFIASKVGRLSNAEQDELTWLHLDEDGEILDDVYLGIKESMGADWIDCGMTKCTIHFEDYPDIVFKIPFFGHITFYYKDDAPAEDPELNYGFPEYSELENSGNDVEWDYCRTETEIFEKAVKDGVDDFFVPLFHLGGYLGFSFYAQEYVLVGLDEMTFTREDRDKGTEIREKAEMKNDIAATQVAKLVAVFGKRKTKHFLDFLREQEIVDLHNGNFGIDNKGKVVLLDYAGYFEDFG